MQKKTHGLFVIIFQNCEILWVLLHPKHPQPTRATLGNLDLPFGKAEDLDMYDIHLRLAS